LGEAVTQLPWLSPRAASLLALARLSPAQAWSKVRDDPGAVLLILRRTASSLITPSLSSFAALLNDPAVLQGAFQFLDDEKQKRESEEADRKDRSACCPDWNQPGIRPIYQASLTYARLAERLAVISQRSDPDRAWVAGLLAPLGWMAVAAIDSEQAAACLSDPDLPAKPALVQQRLWGFDQDGIARRLLRTWGLPRWLMLVVGHLGLSVEIAQSLGADTELLQIVQLAVGVAQQENRGLHLRVGVEPAASAGALGLSAQDFDSLRSSAAEEKEPRITDWSSPRHHPDLYDLLHVAAENLRLRDPSGRQQLEAECDELHQALQDQRSAEEERLQRLKLQALAEFAAGAAHEINNPLAVISGQAQYLLCREEDPARQRALQTIVNQAQRIHQVLMELMQFARPARPQKEATDLRSLAREVVLALADLATQRKVQLDGPEPDEVMELRADSRQIRTAVECLVRNAIEAAPPGGWARIYLQTPSPDRLELVVEDNGCGPGPEEREHLFDPFYSGRQAGRGRGLGLSTAWRLAREHDGEVRYEPLSGGPTRFVLSLPREVREHRPWLADKVA
jgi:signal transduction histidine kinase